jgi:hypothetical protein
MPWLQSGGMKKTKKKEQVLDMDGRTSLVHNAQRKRSPGNKGKEHKAGPLGD